MRISKALRDLGQRAGVQLAVGDDGRAWSESGGHDMCFFQDVHVHVERVDLQIGSNVNQCLVQKMGGKIGKVSTYKVHWDKCSTRRS